jgi:hypothetical protein
LPENDSARSRTRPVTGRTASAPRHLTAWLQSYTGHPAYPLDQLGDDLHRLAFSLAATTASHSSNQATSDPQTNTEAT